MQHREIEYGLPDRTPETTNKSEKKDNKDNEGNNEKVQENIEGAAGKVPENDAQSSLLVEVIENENNTVEEKTHTSAKNKDDDCFHDEGNAGGGGESIEDDAESIPTYEYIDINCCERACGQPPDYDCVKCSHKVCIVDSVGSLHDQTERLCGHCILHFKECEGTFVEKDESIHNNDESDEPIDQPLNYQAHGISTHDEILPVEERTEPESNFNLDFSSSDIDLQNDNNNDNLQNIADDKELDESIDQPLNHQAHDIRTLDDIPRVEERTEPESNFNLDFSLLDIALQNDDNNNNLQNNDEDNELDESIDQPLSHQAHDISTFNNNLPVEPESNFNLDFSFSDIDHPNNEGFEQPCPFVSEEATGESSSPKNVETEKVSNKGPNCLFCSADFIYLGSHLNSSKICRVKYAERLNLGQDASAQSIINTRLKLGRKTYPSRQADRRRLETVKRRENMKNDEVNLFNKFKKKTSISEIIFNCYRCLKLDKREQMQAVEDNLDVSDCFRLENSFWICKKCMTDEEVEIPQTSFIEHFDSRVVGKRNVSVPGFTSIESQDRTLNQTLLFPSSISAASNNFGNSEPKKRKDVIKKLCMGSGRFRLKDFLSPSYEHKLRQLKDSSNFRSSVPGRVVDIEKKKVKIIDSNHTTANVKGSADYYTRLKEDLKFAIYTLGSTFVISKVQLPKVSLLDNVYQHTI